MTREAVSSPSVNLTEAADKDRSQSWNFVDKSGWPMRGEWDSEPDKLQWIDAATDLDCLIHRGPSGALCGYVGVPPGHKFHGLGYSEVEPDPSVHGGLTFASACDETPRPNGGGICHIPLPGRPADVWWLGFDCAHSGDFCPAYSREFSGWESYRHLAYVKHEVANLARQLAEAA